MKKEFPLSYIELSKANLIHNIKQFRGLVKKPARTAKQGGGTKIAGVVKANAYGHGDREVVKILNPYVDYFQVNSVEELERVRKVTKKPILLLGYVGKNDITKAIKLGCILSVFDFPHALLINESARKMGKKVLVHIAIDSFLGREGFMPNEIEKFIPELKKMKNIVIDGIYSHFANIEDTMNFSHAQKQIDTYKNVLDIFEKFGFNNLPAGRQGLKTHISATSGALNKNVPNMNIARIGIGLYGMWPSEHLEFLNKKRITLKPALKWVTHIAQIKNLPPNYPIGYGLTYITKKKTKIAVIPQGYADGLTRSISNKGEVLINCKRAPILGRIAMNMFVVDISNIKNIQTEDEVIVLGKQGSSEITAEEMAEKMGTINYEVTTHINAILPRLIK